ncbi:MAG TPA: M1 family metallopeptidase [Candidatus Saccharimonadales bacterium]|nr:M1 family metallopeptidase [Candidatus Saccharimonadales bacterium]
MSRDVKRLFTQFQPKKYILDMDVDREGLAFHGTVIISGQKTGRPSQRLTLHQHGLKVTAAHVVRHDKKGDQEIIIDRINHHDGFDEVRLHAKHLLYPGLYTMRLTYEGVVSRQMNGVYPSTFEHKGKQKTLIATQFESHHAREAFPCIDEPEAKAIFELTLTSPAGETALSNTQVKSQKAKKGRVTTAFEPTPHMSTYLLAFIFGELGYKEAKTRDGVVVRTYATPDNVRFTDFALDVAVKCLEFYNSYFAIDYPLAKCDLIALPDFASGAMENWGAITFREQAMLVDPKNTTLASKQYVALVVAHELTHQWFGNLVTMRWWTDLWLNEGFASWMEYLAVDHLFPEWHVWTQFIVDEQQQGLKLDALEHTHPIEVPVHHPDEIRTIFDAISYSKGASIIHMLHEYLGPDIFRDGLRHYLTTHKYDNTDTVDLWASLEEISGKPVRDFMHSWTSQPGFPLINVVVNERGIELAQQRFFNNPKHGKTPQHRWPVPLLAGPDMPETFSTESIRLPKHDVNDFKLNRGQSGFYRVAYNATHVQRLGELINKGHLEPLDRLGVLTDLFESAKAGRSDTVDALFFLNHFTQETDYAVWDTIAAAVGNLRLVMDDEPLREAMKPHIRKLIKPELKRLGWGRKKNESHFDRLLRPIILGLAASADEPSIVKRCLSLFESINAADEVAPDLRTVTNRSQVKRGMDIDPDLRGTVFGTIARLGGGAEFDKLLRLHNASALSEERTTIAAALTGFRQPELIQRALALIDSDDVRLQDVAYWIAYSFLNRHAKQQTWQWLESKWGWLEESLGTDLSFYRMPIYAARAFSNPDFIPRYKKFFKARMNPALERSYHQGLEMLEYQSAWKQRSLKEVKSFFKNP